MFFNYRVSVPVQLIVLQRVAGTIDIIKQYTKLHEDIIDNLAGIIDNPENGMLLDATWHGGFDSYMWCLHPTVWLGFYREISDTYALERMRHTNTRCTGSVVSLWVWRLSQKSNSRITLKVVFRFQTLRSLRSILRLLMSCTSVVLQKS